MTAYKKHLLTNRSIFFTVVRLRDADLREQRDKRMLKLINTIERKLQSNPLYREFAEIDMLEKSRP